MGEGVWTMVVGAVLHALAGRCVSEAKLPPVIETNSPYPPEKGDYSFGYYFAASLQVGVSPLPPSFPTIVGGRH